MNPSIIVYDTLPTTMLEARQKARAGHPEGTTIVALAQTSGRGRLGRSWVSEAGTGAYLTTILRPPKERASDLAQLSLVAGIAVCKAVQAFGVTDARLKWPNDVLVGDKKLAGILLENDEQAVLVGIGLNLASKANRRLPEEIAAIYTGVFDHIQEGSWSFLGGSSTTADPPNPRPEVYASRALLQELAAWYDIWKGHGFSRLTDTYAELDALKDSDVRVAATDGHEVVGKARGVNAEGLLRVETVTGMIEVRAGEVERVRR
jgi:BirA family biotin operon repressor/biotin-[acetyl-CoA-carboxylase] ligase